jgi:hypothetical protein
VNIVRVVLASLIFARGTFQDVALSAVPTVKDVKVGLASRIPAPAAFRGVGLIAVETGSAAKAVHVFRTLALAG